MVLKSSLIVLLLSAVAALLYERFHVLSLFYYNAPGRMPAHANFASAETRFADRIRSCEDVLLVRSRGVAIAACDPGREIWNAVMGVFQEEPDPPAGLYLFRYADPALADDQALARFDLVGFQDQAGDPMELRTLGIEFHEPSSTLFVTNHRRAGAQLEVFRLDFDAGTATHVRSIAHPLLRTPNSIALVGESADELLVTNQHHFLVGEYPVLSLLETYLAPPIATVVHVRLLPDGAVDAAVVARVPYANGVVFVNETTVAVAATSKAAVFFYTFTAAAPSSPSLTAGSRRPTLTYRSRIQVPFLPDNLSIIPGSHDNDSVTLLIGGHPHPPTLIAFAHSRQVCNRPDELAKPANAHMQERCAAIPPAPSWVVEWTEEQGLRHVYAGSKYPSSAGAVKDKEAKLGIVGGLYARGLMVWRE